MQVGSDAEKVKAAAALMEEANTAAKEVYELVNSCKAFLAFEGVGIIACTAAAAVANRCDPPSLLVIPSLCFSLFSDAPSIKKISKIE
jgi:hypothetical protein